MQVIILAAGQGTRLRPITDSIPKCMVPVNGKSLILRQLESMNACGIRDEQIAIVGGYCEGALHEHLSGRTVRFLTNEQYATTNMVCSLMCASELMRQDAIVSYGDILFTPAVLGSLLESRAHISVVIDDDWQSYWMTRGEDWFSDAETLKLDPERGIVEIGQKPTGIEDVQSQYIGLMRFQNEGVRAVLDICREAKARSEAGQALWRTSRDYAHMYMTDLLQALIDTGSRISPVHIQRGWFEIDDPADLRLVESQLE